MTEERKQALEPPAVRWANYKGDVSGDIKRVVGPNTMGEMLRIVEFKYDPGTDTTRVGFSYTARGVQRGKE